MRKDNHGCCSLFVDLIKGLGESIYSSFDFVLLLERNTVFVSVRPVAVKLAVRGESQNKSLKLVCVHNSRTLIRSDPFKTTIIMSMSTTKTATTKTTIIVTDSFAVISTIKATTIIILMNGGGDSSVVRAPDS